MPASTVPGERASRTQPVPRLPEPFARQTLTADLLTRRTPEAHAWAAAELAKMHNGGPFTPLQIGKDTVVFPGFDGGAEWGGSAYDPASGRLFVNANDLAWTGALAPDDGGTDGRSVYLKSCANCHRDDRRGTPPQIPALTNLTPSAEQLTTVIRQGVGRMPGFPNLSPEAVRAPGRLPAGRARPRRAAGAKTDGPGHAHRAPALHRLQEVPRSRRLPRGRAAVGHAERDRPEHRRLRVEDPARRVSGAGGARA